MADWLQIAKEFLFYTSRSSGAGGQHVNKVETKVRLCFSIDNSIGLSTEEKEILKNQLSSKLDNEANICLTVQKSRSQTANKQEAHDKMIDLIKKALIPPKKRKKTNVPISEKIKRLDGKKTRSKVKDLRKKPKI